MASIRKNKKKLSERVSKNINRDQMVSPAVEEVMQEIQQPSITPSAAAAAKSVERDTSNTALKVLEHSADLQQESVEVDKKLLKAVTELTKSMEFGNKKKDKEEKKGGISGYVQGKIQSVKSAFTLEGAAGLAGIERDSGTLAGAVLGSVMGRKEKKEQAKQAEAAEEGKKAEYIAKFGEFTEKGRELKQTGGMEAVIAEGEKLYERLTAAQSAIDELEAKQKEIEKFGGTLSVEDTRVLETAKYTKEKVQEQYKVTPPKPMTRDEKKQELVSGAVEGMKQEISSLSDEEKEALQKADPEYLKSVFEGALAGLTEVNEKQLDQLVALVNSSKVSEEDKLEASNKENIVASIQDPKEDKKKDEEGGGIMKAIMDMIGSKFSKVFSTISGFFSSIPGMLSGMLGGARKMLGGLASGTKAAGAAVLGGGKKIIDSVLSRDSVPDKMNVDLDSPKKVKTPDVDLETPKQVKTPDVDTKAKPKGFLSKAMGGLGKAGNIAKAVLGKAGPIAALGMAAYDAYSGFTEAGQNLGIEGREATTGEKLSSAAGSALSGLTFGMLGKDTASKGIASLFGAGPDVEKAETPNRVAQAVELSQNKDQLDQASKEMSTAVNQPIVTNAPTTIINNSTNTSVRAPIRNTDHSYNNRLSRNFVY